MNNDDPDGTGPIPGCQANCALATCGDGITGPGEACDDGAKNGMTGNNPGGPSCTKNCTLNVCGDGFTLDAEGCDDGNSVNTDGCLNTCVKAACGDGVTDSAGSPPAEECDDGNTVDAEGATGGTDGCSGHCCWEPTVPLSTTQAMVDAELCNVDELNQQVVALPPSRTKSRLTRHVINLNKAAAQVATGLASGKTKVVCNAEKRKDRVDVCIQRAIDLGLLRGDINAFTHNEITQTNLNIHGWVQDVKGRVGCL